jgi:Holliday junction resolvase RusA-like endonuclease
MLILDLYKVILPRVNDRYNRNFSLKDSYRKNKEILIKEILKKCKNAPEGYIKKPYSIGVEVGTHLDIDSFIKPLLDAMQSAGVIENDKDVLELFVKKIKLKRTEANYIKVCLNTYKA